MSTRKPKTPNKSNLAHFVTLAGITIADAEQDGGLRHVATGVDCKTGGFTVEQAKKYLEMGLVGERAALVKSDAGGDKSSEATIADLRTQLAAEKTRADEAETKAEENEKLAAKAGADLKKANDELAKLKAK